MRDLLPSMYKTCSGQQATARRMPTARHAFAIPSTDRFYKASAPLMPTRTIAMRCNPPPLSNPVHPIAKVHLLQQRGSLPVAWPSAFAVPLFPQPAQKDNSRAIEAVALTCPHAAFCCPIWKHDQRLGSGVPRASVSSSVRNIIKEVR